MAHMHAPADGNWVKEAIRRLGGPTKAVIATGMSAGTIERWRKTGHIADVAVLFQIAELTGINPRLLAGLEAKKSGSSSGWADPAEASEPLGGPVA